MIEMEYILYDLKYCHIQCASILKLTNVPLIILALHIILISGQIELGTF